MAIREEIIKELKEFEEKIDTNMINIFNLLNQLVTSQSHLFQILESAEIFFFELIRKIQEQLSRLEEFMNQSDNTNINRERTPIIKPQKVKLSKIKNKKYF